MKGDWALHFWFQEVTLGNEPIKLGKNTKIFINEFSSLPFLCTERQSRQDMQHTVRNDGIRKNGARTDDK